MAYKVIIMPPAKRRLDMYVYYTLETLKNRQAAKSILADAKETKKRLSIIADSLKICDDPLLAQYEYRKNCFVKHKFVMIYRIEGTQVIVDGMFHELQDYEGIFAREYLFRTLSDSITNCCVKQRVHEVIIRSRRREIPRTGAAGKDGKGYRVWQDFGYP